MTTKENKMPYVPQTSYNYSKNQNSGFGYFGKFKMAEYSHSLSEVSYLRS